MKFKYINPSPYIFQGRNVATGDVIDLPENVGRRFAHLFICIEKPKKVVKEKQKKRFKLDEKLSIKQLKELAKRYNIKLENGLAKKDIITKINFALPNE